MNLQENIDRIKNILSIVCEDKSSYDMNIEESGNNTEEFKFVINNEVVGMMRGTKEGNTFWLDRIVIYPSWRGKGLGEKFLMLFLDKFGGSVGSKSQLRNRHATKMWERIINRSDVQYDKNEIYSEYMNDKVPTYKVWR